MTTSGVLRKSNACPKIADPAYRRKEHLLFLIAVEVSASNTAIHLLPKQLRLLLIQFP